jgi:peptidoglycan hydrolase-like protein with peptidoglycan-binding domain
MGQGGNVQSENADQQEQSQTTQSNSGDRNKIASVNLDRSQIEQVQRALDQKGFNVGHVDGIVGNETEGALRSFQQKQGLQASGQIDQETLAALGLQHMMQPSTVGQGSQKNPEPQGSNQSGSKK